jgi:hypothetical protein
MGIDYAIDVYTSRKHCVKDVALFTHAYFVRLINQAGTKVATKTMLITKKAS